jgi:hypothetical protein
MLLRKKDREDGKMRKKMEAATVRLQENRIYWNFKE